jgi:hypothetical protein
MLSPMVEEQRILKAMNKNKINRKIKFKTN